MEDSVLKGIQPFLFTPLSECNTQHLKVAFKRDVSFSAILGYAFHVFAFHDIPSNQIKATKDQYHNLIECVLTIGPSFRLKIIMQCEIFSEKG
jgi:hypothetical protein